MQLPEKEWTDHRTNGELPHLNAFIEAQLRTGVLLVDTWGEEPKDESAIFAKTVPATAPYNGLTRRAS